MCTLFVLASYALLCFLNACPGQKTRSILAYTHVFVAGTHVSAVKMIYSGMTCCLRLSEFVGAGIQACLSRPPPPLSLLTIALDNVRKLLTRRD
jgi:hypothetical protein